MWNVTDLSVGDVRGPVGVFQLLDNQLHNPQHKGRATSQQLDGTCVTVVFSEGLWTWGWNHTGF